MIWQERAACRGEPVSIFFPPENDPGGQTAALAKAVCSRCSVVAECFEQGYRTHSDGVWGGTTPKERRSIRRRRRYEQERAS